MTVVDALDQETRFEYDLLGNRTRVIDAKGQQTTFVYDDVGRLVEIVNRVIEAGSDKTHTFQYDEAGNVIVETDREGATTHFTYDPLNRLERAEYLGSGEAGFRILKLARDLRPGHGLDSASLGIRPPQPERRQGQRVGIRRSPRR